MTKERLLMGKKKNIPLQHRYAHILTDTLFISVLRAYILTDNAEDRMYVVIVCNVLLLYYNVLYSYIVLGCARMCILLFNKCARQLRAPLQVW